jgi:RHS repeat-associated protein
MNIFQSNERDLGDTSDPVSGQAFAYSYDNIGNRLSSSRDSEEVSYTANSLNAYSLRTVSDLIDILGSASTNSTVKVNTLATSRHAKYWHKGLTVTNSGNAVYQDVEVIGIDTNSTTNILYSIETGHVFVAKTPEQFTYDDDGNLLSDGRFSYSWDCEGHLVGADTLTNLPASVPLISASYSYDYMSRRSRKVVGSTTNTFVYDNWNLVKETSTAGYTNFYVWGLDLSGTIQGAGGVGGLLAVIRSDTNSPQPTVYRPTYDANGNITDYVDTNGVVVAHREYDPFGNTIVATGSMVNDFHFWFSTKYLDHETGLYYYGYRYYSPSLGRWLSRDPIGDEGSIYWLQKQQVVKKQQNISMGMPIIYYKHNNTFDMISKDININPQSLLDVHRIRHPYAFTDNGPNNRYDILGLEWRTEISKEWVAGSWVNISSEPGSCDCCEFGYQNCETWQVSQDMQGEVEVVMTAVYWDETLIHITCNPTGNMRNATPVGDPRREFIGIRAFPCGIA